MKKVLQKLMLTGFLVSFFLSTFSQGIHFDGTDDYVNLGAWNAPTNITVEAWIKADALDGNRVIVSQFDSWPTSTSYILRMDGAMVGFYLTDGTNSVIVNGSGPLNTGEWYHIAATYDGSTAIVYINGLYTDEAGGSVSLYQSATVNHQIGGPVYHDEYFSGIIDEVRIWSVARTNCEIQQAMYTRLLGSETGLISYYSCDEGTSNGDNTATTTLTDKTGTHTGTMLNFALTGTSSNWVPGTPSVNSDGVFVDTFDPIIDNATLSDVTAECQVSSLTPPTATDVCAGALSGTHNATLPITTQGTTPVTWTYDDGSGNSVTQTQNVIINDISKPVPDVPTLADINAVGEVTSLTKPTATDACKGSIDGTHNATLPINTVGTTVVTWTYDDGNGNTETQTQNVVISEPLTPPGNALHFDGADDYVDCGNAITSVLQGTNLITVEAWVKLEDYTAPTIVGNYEGAEMQFLLRIDSKKPTFWVNYSSISAPNDLPLSTWTHIVGTYDGTKLKIYINGILANSKNLAGALSTTAVPLRIGRNQPSELFTGYIDEVRIWNVARTNCEILEAMNTELIGDETGLLAYYNFNSGIAAGNNAGITTLTDESGKGYNGTLYSFAFTGTTSNWVTSGADITGVGQYATDNTPPVPDVPTLSNITAECQVTVPTAPTATDVCAGVLNGTSNVTFPITTQGTTVVTWTYDDGSGNSVTQTQNVIINDISKPVPDVPTLADVNAFDIVSSLAAPTATDACAGSITATSDAALPITTVGTTVVTWTYNDGNGNTETQTQNVVITASAPTEALGNALNFDGGDDYVDCGYGINNALEGTNTITVECWVYLAENAFSSTVVGNYINSPNVMQMRLRVDNQKPTFAIDNGSVMHIEANSTIPLGTWTHLAGIWDGSTIKIYINGVLDNSMSASGGSFLANTAFPVRIGYSTAGINWKGNLDEIRIWSTARTETEIQEDMSKSLVGDEAGLLAYYNFDHGTPGDDNTGVVNLVDQTANGHDGLLYNFTLNGTISNWIGSGVVATSNENNALDFDGSNDWVDASNNGGAKTSAAALGLSASNITVEAWCNIHSFGPYKYILGFIQDNNSSETGWAMGASASGVEFALSSVGSNTLSYTSYPVNGNEWIHIAMSYDGTTQTNYINGEVVGTIAKPGGINYIDSWLAVGTFKDDNEAYYFDGQIDEVRIWNTTRTQTDIQQNMNNELVGDETGLVTYYNFNQGVAGGDNAGVTTLIDQTGNAHGTLNTFTLNGDASNWIASGAFDDNTAPVPDVATLSDFIAECEVTSLPKPTATDAVDGSIDGTHNLTLPITTQGTTVATWSYEDANGNIATQTQNIVIADVTNPVITCVADTTIMLARDFTTYSIDSTELDPIDFADNCSIASLVNDFNNTDSLKYETLALGQHTITWTVTDAKGNTGTCATVVDVVEYVQPLCTTDPVLNGVSVDVSDVCEGDSVTITIDGALNDASSWYLYHGRDTVIFGISTENTYRYLATDTTTIYVAPHAECAITASIDTVTTNVNIKPAPLAHANLVLPVCEGDEVTLQSEHNDDGVTYTWSGGAVNGTPLTVFASEMFYLSASKDGCTSTDSSFIEVRPHVMHTVDTSLCIGESIVLDGISISKDTSFTRSFSGLYVCDSTVTYNVVVNDLPTISIVESYPTPVCNGSTVVLTAQGAETYEWTNEIENGVAFEITESATFYVNAMDAKHCQANDSIIINVSKLDNLTFARWDSVPFTCPGHDAVFDIYPAQSDMFFYLTVNDVVVNGPVRGNADHITLTATAVMNEGMYKVYASPDSSVNSDFTTIACTALVDSVFVNFKPLIEFTEHPADYENCEGQLLELSYNAFGTADALTWERSVDGINYTTLDLVSEVVDSTENEETTLWLNSASAVNNSSWYRVAAENCGTYIYSNPAKVMLHALPAVNAGDDVALCEGSEFTFMASGADSIAWNNSVYNDSTYVLTQSNNYVVTGLSAEGCINTDTIAITVNPNYVLNNNFSICEGDSVVVGESVYYETGVYEDIFTTISGCDSLVYTNLTVNPTPHIHAAGSDEIYITEGSELTLTASGGVEYVWDNDVVNGESFIPVESLTYTVIGSDENGCSSTDTVRVTVQSELASMEIAGLGMTCFGDEPVVELYNAQPDVLYYLADAETNQLVDGPVFAYAENETLSFSPGVVNTASSFNVRAHNLNSESKSFMTNGFDEYLSIPDASQLNMQNGEFTVEAWIIMSMDNPTTKTGIISKATGINDSLFNGWQIKLENNKLFAQISNGIDTVTLNAADTLNDMQWHHVALVINTANNTATLYIDGEQESSVIDAAVSNNIINSSPVIIGTDKSKQEFMFLAMDELKFWRKAKTDAEILASMYTVPLGYEQDLSGYYNFNSQTGITAFDKTNFANHGITATEFDDHWSFGLLANNIIVSKDVVFDAHSDVAFTQQPVADMACYGSDIVLNYALSGTVDSVLWYTSIDNGAVWIPTSTDTELILSQVTDEVSGMQLKAVAFKCGAELISSDVVTLQVNNPIITSVSQDETSLMAVMAGATYQWLNCDEGNAAIEGATNQLFIPAATGNYAVAITVDNCMDTSACYYFSTTGDHLDKDAEITAIALSDNLICPEETVTITVNGILNSAKYWAIYTDGCATTLVDTSLTGVFNVSPAEYTTYYVRGEAADMQWGACTEIAVDVAPLPYLDAGYDMTVCEGESVTLDAVCNGTFTWDNNWENGHTFVPTEDMTLHITASNEQGCTVSDSIQIHLVYPVSYTQNLEIMLGEVVQVGESVYSDAGTYTDVLTSAVGCDSTVTTNISILPMAEVEACEPFELVIPESVFEGLNLATTTFTATMANGDPLPEWLEFNAETLTFYGDAPCNGEIYDIIVTADDGRKAVVTYQFTIETTVVTGVDVNGFNPASIYPNPNNGIFYLETGMEKVDKVMVRDLNGRILMLKENVTNHSEFNLSNYHSGTYLIQVINNNKISFIKLIKL